jgi:hypothetical protein
MLLRAKQFIVGLFLVLIMPALQAGIIKGYYDGTGGGTGNLSAIHASAEEARRASR